MELKEKFIDGLCYDHEFESKIKGLIGINDDEDINYIDVNTFVNAKFKPVKSSNKITVLYATGEIYESGSNDGINSDELVPSILELAKDDDVKGLVLRVNSPGCSAFAS